MASNHIYLMMLYLGHVLNKDTLYIAGTDGSGSFVYDTVLVI